MEKSFLFIFLSFFALRANAQDGRKLVIATASIFADMAENIAGGEVEIKTIVPIGGDPHIYEPTHADAQLVAKADLILKNGLTLESWLDGLIESAGSGATVEVISNGVEPIGYKNLHGPHAWMAAPNGIFYIENIKNALVELLPDSREIFEFNYGVYRKQMEDMDTYIYEQVDKIPEKRRVLITSHDAFRYYGRRYGLRLESLIGVSTEAGAQASDVIRLGKAIRESGVPAVFIETTADPKLLAQIAKDSGVAIGGNLFSDSIGGPQSDAPNYLDMLKFNTDTIVKALTAEAPEEQGPNWLLWGILAILLIGGFLWGAKWLNGLPF